MNASDINPLPLLGLIALLSCVLFWLWKHFCFNELGYSFQEDAIVIDSLGGPFKLRIPFEQIQSVEISKPSVLGALKWFPLSLFTYREVSRFKGNRVIIKRLGSVRFRYVIFTPKDAADFVEQLRKKTQKNSVRVSFKNC